MSAADACNSNYTSWMRCYECGSTPLGAPVDYEIDFKQRVLDAVSDDILLNASEGWALWQWGKFIGHGFLDAASLRVIADELDRRNKEWFADEPS
jgi:hypothetical protein